LIDKFQDDLNTTFRQISEWFQLNSLSLNISKTHFTQFSSKSLNDSDINITYENNYISKVNYLNFLGLNINNTLSWKTHINKILPKLSSACFAMQAVKQFMSPQMLKAIYYSHFHSIISYGVIFWGHIAPSTRVFRLQKRNYKSNLHQPIANLSKYHKGAYYSGIKVYNSLPTQIKDLSADRKQFGHALKSFLYSHPFYTLDEYLKKCNKH